MNICRLFCIALLISALVNAVHGQNKIINIDPDDRGFYDFRSDAEKKMHLPDMTIVKDGRHWRFWYDKYVSNSFTIDISGTDSLNCKAFITAYTFGDVIYNDKDKFGKVYYKQISLDPAVARKLYQAAIQVNIGRFATRDTLEGVKSIYGATRVYVALDSFPYTVEYADEKRYIFRTGLRPENKTQFGLVINTATQLIDFEKIKDDFEKNIPFGYYSADKWMVMTVKLTPKQIRQYSRYWRKHRV
ncbi:MAG TPA: hypothetical protein VGI43_09865 [Mucilaginibacter sp.]|jgi:hypothetical protein